MLTWIVDLDGTVCDVEHRRHWVRGKKKNWRAFHEGCVNDTPTPALEVVASLWEAGYKILFFSGRFEEYREHTLNWFKNLEVFPEGVIGTLTLKMRPDGDYTPDDQLKERWLEEHLEAHPEDQILGVFDDRPKVVRMWKRRGYFVFDCNQPGEEF